MIGYAVLLLLAATQPAAAPQLNDVVSAWTDRAAAIESADVELRLTRDSRDGSFGERGDENDRPKVRLRFDRTLRQMEVSRLTVVRRDGRTEAAEADPDRARVEFRNVLLEEQLQGPQMVPHTDLATLIIDAAGVQSGQHLSTIDRLVAEAPLWSALPLRLVDQNQLEHQSDNERTDWLRLIEKQGDDHRREIWIEPDAPYRPLRILERHAQGPAWQIDLTWAAEEPRFATRYFVQTINSSGETLDFAEASLVRVETPLTASTDFGHIAGSNSDLPDIPEPTAIRTREVARKVLDSNLLPIALLGVGAIFVAGRGRRERKVR